MSQLREDNIAQYYATAAATIKLAPRETARLAPKTLTFLVANRSPAVAGRAPVAGDRKRRRRAPPLGRVRTRTGHRRSGRVQEVDARVWRQNQVDMSRSECARCAVTWTECRRQLKCCRARRGVVINCSMPDETNTEAQQLRNRTALLCNARHLPDNA